MRRRTLPVELLLLAFLTAFLVYPVAYVIPGSASEEVYDVRLLGMGRSAGDMARVAALLTREHGSPEVLRINLPHTVGTFPAEGRAKGLAGAIRSAGGEADVVRRRRWTAFY